MFVHFSAKQLLSVTVKLVKKLIKIVTPTPHCFVTI